MGMRVCLRRRVAGRSPRSVSTHEVALGALVGLEGDGGAGADPHARQGRPPGGHRAADQHLVRQAVARHLDHHGRCPGRAQSSSGRRRRPSADRPDSVPRTLRGSGNGREGCSLWGGLQDDQNSRGAADVLGFCRPCPSASTLAAESAPPEEAKVSVFDRGFLYGDSVYETIGTAHGKLFAARDHLVRLAALGGTDRPARAAHGRPSSRRSPRRSRPPGSRSRACASS